MYTQRLQFISSRDFHLDWAHSTPPVQPLRQGCRDRHRAMSAIGGGRSSRNTSGLPRSSVRRLSVLSRTNTQSLPAAIVENKHKFRGERIGMLHFFTQWPEVILRRKGSVLPNVVIELSLSFILGLVAHFLYHPPTFLGDVSMPVWSHEGHAIFAVLLGFLMVFRTQAGFNLHLQGQDHCVQLISSLRNVAVDVLGTMPSNGLSREEAHIILNLMRRLKLFYYTIIEHLRSYHSYRAWLDAHAMVLRYASDQETEQFALEFGEPTRVRKDIGIPTDVFAGSTSYLMNPALLQTESSASKQSSLVGHSAKTKEVRKRCSMLMASASALKDVGPREGAGSFIKGCGLAAQLVGAPSGAPSKKMSFLGGVSSSGSPSGHKGGVLPDNSRRLATFESQDPTISKPVLVALLVRRDISHLARLGHLSDPHLARLGACVDKISDAYCEMSKIDQIVLPLPYSQLLKIFIIFFVFTVPFVLAPLVGALTPVLTLFLAAGYFGLDQVGAELERPFGVAEYNMPLLEMGNDLCRNIDTAVRALMREVRDDAAAKQESKGAQPGVPSSTLGGAAQLAATVSNSAGASVGAMNANVPTTVPEATQHVGTRIDPSLEAEPQRQRFWNLPISPSPVSV